MTSCVVFDEQPLFAYALAAAVQHYTDAPTRAVPSLPQLRAALDAAEVRTVILSLRGDPATAGALVGTVRQAAWRPHLLCLIAGAASDVERAVLAAGADAVLPRTRFLRDVAALAQPPRTRSAL